MSTARNRRRAARACSLAVLAACVAHAIEAPKPQPAPEPQPEAPPPQVNVTPTDETRFYEKAAARDALIAACAGCASRRRDREPRRAATPTRPLQRSARSAIQGNREANIALVRIQHWCNTVSQQRAGDPKAQIAKLVKRSAASSALRASPA